MSYQVGNFCYATDFDAANAQCAAYTPISSITSGVLTATTCNNATTDGYVNLFVTKTNLTTGVTTTSFVLVPEAAGSCIYPDVADAAEVIIGGLLSLYVIWVCGWRIINLIGWSRQGDHE